MTHPEGCAEEVILRRGRRGAPRNRAGPKRLTNQLVANERLSDGVRYAREFMEREEDRLAVERPAFAKRYAEGRLTVLVKLQPLAPDGAGELCAIFNEDYPLGPDDLFEREVSGGASEGEARNREPSFPKGRLDHDGHLVFVCNAGFVEKPQVFVPRWVGFELLHDLERRLDRWLMYSCKTGFQFFGGIRKGEVGALSAVSLSLSRDRGAAPENIELERRL